MFRFISEMTFYGVLFYVVTLIMGLIAGICVSRMEREGGSKALLRNILNTTRTMRYADSEKLSIIKAKIEAWEAEENEHL